MSKDISLDILPDGRMRFRRGDSSHNKRMMEILSLLIDEEDEIMSELAEFFDGSEKIELLIGDTIFCG